MEYWNSYLETMPRQELDRLQFERFKNIFIHAYNNSEAHRELYDSCGLTPESLRTMDDIRLVPLTDKKFLVNSAGGSLYGNSLSIPEEKVVFYHQTSGTTSAPVPQPDSLEDWYYHGECWAAALWAHGVRPSDKVMVAFNYNLFIGFWQCHYGCEKLGAEIIPGGGLPTEVKLQKMQDLGVSVLATTPSYAFRMAERAQEMGIDIRNGPVRILITSGEPGALIASVKERLSNLWGAEVYDNIGATEIGSWGFECEAHPGAMHINESNFLPEIIGLEDDEPVTEPGVMGRLVLTNFFREGRPCIRFNTNDIVCWADRDCSCGRTYRMLDGGVRGRADHILKVRGTFVNPAVIEDILNRHELCGHEYNIVIHADNNHILVRSEAAEGLAEERFEEVARDIKEQIHRKTFVKMDVEMLPFATLERSEGGKSKRIIDLRKEGGIWSGKK